MTLRSDHVAQDQVDGLSNTINSIPTVTVSATAPASPVDGDLWLDSSSGNQINEWNGTSWVPAQLGTNAIAAGAVTASQIAAGTVVAGIVDGTTISGSTFIAHGTSGEILVYNGTPAHGNLILVIASGSGTDSYGNSWGQGLTLPLIIGEANINFPSTDSFGNYAAMNQGGTASAPVFSIYSTADNGVGVPLASPQMQLGLDHTAGQSNALLTASQVYIQSGYPSGGTASSSTTIKAADRSTSYWQGVEIDLTAPTGGIILRGDGATSSQYAEIAVQYGGTVQIGSPLSTSGPNQISVAVDVKNGIRMGSGPQGGYYYEEVAMPAQSITNGVVTQVAGYTAGQLNSDYGSAWNLSTGVWTCPATGPYDWTVATGYSGSVNGFRGFIRVCETLNTGPFFLIDDVTMNVGNFLYSAGTFYATAGATYHVETYQATSSAKTLQAGGISYVHIGRRL